MYVSPIEKICGEIQTQMIQEDENMVMKAVREVGITVDKEELIDALRYDRKQYTKGYSDGKSDTIRKVRAEIEWQEKWLMTAGYTAYNVDTAFNAIKFVIAESGSE
jgi:hypothetical protein